MLSFQQIKQILVLSLAFIITIQAGAFLTEQVRCIVAQQYGYSISYFTAFGDLVFENPDDQEKLESIAKKYGEEREVYSSSSEWKAMEKKTGYELGVIELAGLLFTILISIIGLFLFYWRRHQNYSVKINDWIYILMGLFFMKHVCYYTFFYVVLGAVPCITIYMFPSIGLNFFEVVKLFIALGWLALAVIIYSLPAQFRLKFLLSGIIGVPIGALLWLYVVGQMVF